MIGKLFNVILVLFIESLRSFNGDFPPHNDRIVTTCKNFTLQWHRRKYSTEGLEKFIILRWTSNFSLRLVSNFCSKHKKKKKRGKTFPLIRITWKITFLCFPPKAFSIFFEYLKLNFLWCWWRDRKLNTFTFRLIKALRWVF